jgi:hypothetical protein
MRVKTIVNTRSGSTYEFTPKETHVRRNDGVWRELRIRPDLWGFRLFLIYAGGGVALSTHIREVKHLALAESEA